MDLSSFIQKAACECLNESDDHPLEHALTSTGGFLQSDCDEQVIQLLYWIYEFYTYQLFSNFYG